MGTDDEPRALLALLILAAALYALAWLAGPPTADPGAPPSAGRGTPVGGLPAPAAR